MLNFSLNYAVSGFHTINYHIVNIILHIGVCIVLYRLLLKIFILFEHSKPDRLAYHTSLLFAVHPIHSEAVSLLKTIYKYILNRNIFVTVNLKTYSKIIVDFFNNVYSIEALNKYCTFIL